MVSLDFFFDLILLPETDAKLTSRACHKSSSTEASSADAENSGYENPETCKTDYCNHAVAAGEAKLAAVVLAAAVALFAQF